MLKNIFFFKKIVEKCRLPKECAWSLITRSLKPRMSIDAPSQRPKCDFAQGTTDAVADFCSVERVGLQKQGVGVVVTPVCLIISKSIISILITKWERTRQNQYQSRLSISLCDSSNSLPKRIEIIRRIFFGVREFSGYKIRVATVNKQCRVRFLNLKLLKLQT